ncbi:MAG: nitroreductase family protein [Sulfobacillus sp.]
MTSAPHEALWQAIHDRSTIYHFTPDPLPAGVVDQLIEAATWAPNHRLTEPWRFVVAAGESKQALAQLRGDLARQRAEREGRGLDRVAAQVAEFDEPPVYLYVVQQLAGDDSRQREDYAACAIAAYIVQLTAHSMGIGARWGTGLMATDPAVHRFLGLESEQQIVCFLGLGYERPSDRRVRLRRQAAEVTRYLGALAAR